LVLEETFVVIPRPLCGASRQTRQVVRIGNWFVTATLGRFREQCEIEPLDWFAAFGGQFRPDAALILESGNFVAASATEMPDPLLPFVLQRGIIHEGRIRIRRRLLLL